MRRTSSTMVAGVAPEIPARGVLGNGSAMVDLLLSWGQSLAGASGIDSLRPLLAGLPRAVCCEHVSLWLGRSDGNFDRLFADKDGLTHTFQITPPPRRALLWNSTAAISTELPPLIPCLPAGMAHAMAIPIQTNGECLGLLCVADHDRYLTTSDLEQLSGLVGIIAQVMQAHILQERHRRTEERRELLDHIRSHFQRTLNLEVLIARILEEVNTAIHADAQSIWLVDEPAGLIRCRFATGPGAEVVKKITVPLGEGIVGNTVARQESLLIADAQCDVRHSRRADNQTGITTHSLVSVPLVRDGRAIGAIQAINKRDLAYFTPDDVELLQSIADTAALAIENAHLYAELENSYDATLQALTAALDARDHETEGHSRRVVEYAVRLAQQIGLSSGEMKTLRRGAMIHDIGKIGIPDAILHKPGTLTAEERKVMERHPEIGFEMLREVPHLDNEVKLVLAHQERWDGSGYPYRLKEQEIPLFARLFAIADAFDAILSDRPYRRGRPYGIARAIIAEESGRQFDPDLVEAFLSISEEEWHAIRLRCYR